MDFADHLPTTCDVCDHQYGYFSLPTIVSVRETYRRAYVEFTVCCTTCNDWNEGTVIVFTQHGQHADETGIG
jgi:hypothetical protein